MKTDSHCHSTYAIDDKATPEEMVAAAANQNIDVLAITDHADFAAGDSRFDPKIYLEHLNLHILRQWLLVLRWNRTRGLHVKLSILAGR